MIIEKLNPTTEKIKNIRMFLYGDIMTGKTKLATTFPKPLLISTDGNIQSKDKLNENGDIVGQEDILVAKINYQMTTKTQSGIEIKKSGWDVFKELVDTIVDKLSKSDSVETIVVDLLKDIYEMCRLKVLKQLGVKHEQDAGGFGKAYALIDAEFFPVMKKLLSCGKHVILIAHEGEADTGVKPNFSKTQISKISGYTNVFARLMVENKIGGKTERVLYAKPTKGQVGGNRLGMHSVKEPTYEKIIKEIKGE